jgi:cytochrome c oxidase assembly protein subunit 15
LRPSGAATRFSRAALAFSVLVFVTILAGGFVAGLDAGMSYNTFPLMDGRLVPAGYLDETPWWANLFENVAAVQFNHRVLAMLTLAGALALAVAGRMSCAHSLALATGGVALLQVALGISTLLLVVPIPLAAAHQAGAVALLTFALATAHAARVKP